jgi:hypothetical protein
MTKSTEGQYRCGLLQIDYISRFVSQSPGERLCLISKFSISCLVVPFVDIRYCTFFLVHCIHSCRSRMYVPLLFFVPALVAAQSADLQGLVGPLTSISEKKAVKTCNITDYGATADGTTDISSALIDAFTDCSTGGVVVVPSGDYALSTWVDLSGGNAWALQLDGVITRTGNEGGNMIFIEHGSDFEMFSSTGQGAMQGLGYEFHNEGSLDGPRLLRTYDMSNFSIHDIILVDSPAFHLSLDTCYSGEVYNLAIRGGDSGGLDGIDVWSNDIWIHDVMVTNKVFSRNIGKRKHSIADAEHRMNASPSSHQQRTFWSRTSTATGLAAAQWVLSESTPISLTSLIAMCTRGRATKYVRPW